MLLAAGRGERMEPLSSLVPKPALEVLGRPLLASALEHLWQAGCRRVVVNLHRHPAAVAAAARGAADAHDSLELLFSHEPALLGGAGGIGAARPLLGGGPVLIANGDVHARLDLAPLLVPPGDDEVVLGLVAHPDPTRWSAVTLDRGGRVAAIVPPNAAAAGAASFLFTGFQVLGSGVLASLAAHPAELPPVWEGCRRRGALRGVVLEGDWREAGSPAAYRELVVGLLAGGIHVHAQAAVAAGARLTATAVGAGCAVASRARLDGSVLTLGARIGEGAVIERCVVGAAEIPAGARYADALILPERVLPL